MCLASGMPFVGFGFADNFIMILVGDQIDCSLGVTFGLSTMAAAALGNTFSDVIGISLGEFIEAWMSRFFRSPPLTRDQLNLRVARLSKGLANAFGITIGCLLGMLPLLWITDRKEVYFTDEELELFHAQFAPCGVPPSAFFDLLKDATWHEVEPGTVLVQKGEGLRHVMFLTSGAAHGLVTDHQGKQKPVYLYEGRITPEPVPEELSHLTRGCIIGGSALVDEKLLGKPYPTTVMVTQKARYLEWDTEQLRKDMQTDKSMEAAMLNTLYQDLVRGIRNQRQGAKARATAAALREYSVMLRAVVADGLVHPLEKQMLRESAAENGVTEEQHLRMLDEMGWTPAEWEKGVRGDLSREREKLARSYRDTGEAVRGDIAQRVEQIENDAALQRHNTRLKPGITGVVAPDHGPDHDEEQPRADSP